MKILQMYRRLRSKKRMKRIASYVDLGQSYYGEGFSVDLRHPVEGKKYLYIGNQCMIDGQFIFETDAGYISVGDRTHIGGSTLISRSGISIGNDVTIAWNCTIYDHNSHSTNWEERKNDTVQEYIDMASCGDPIQNKDWSKVVSKPIVICDKVWIGLGVTILKGVTIGEGSIVAAGSVVVSDVPEWTVVGGNPAQVVKRLK